MTVIAIINDIFHPQLPLSFICFWVSETSHLLVKLHFWPKDGAVLPCSGVHQFWSSSPFPPPDFPASSFLPLLSHVDAARAAWGETKKRGSCVSYWGSCAALLSPSFFPPSSPVLYISALSSPHFVRRLLSVSVFFFFFTSFLLSIAIFAALRVSSSFFSAVSHIFSSSFIFFFIFLLFSVEFKVPGRRLTFGFVRAHECPCSALIARASFHL